MSRAIVVRVLCEFASYVQVKLYGIRFAFAFYCEKCALCVVNTLTYTSI